MRTTRKVGGLAVAALVVFLSAGWAAAAPAPESTDLRKQALKLNEITGEDAILGRVFELIEDGRAAKPLLAEAAKMAKEKDQPFNINATLVLARSAQLLRETDVSETFFRLHIDQATQLESYQRIGEGYNGLIKALYEGKKYDESEKACEEFLAMQGPPALQRLKPNVIRQMVLILARQGKTDKAGEMIDKIVKSQPDNPLNQITKGQFLIVAEKFDEAAKAYESAIDLIKKDEDLTKDEQEDFIGGLRYTLSGVYIELKDVDKAAEQLQALLERNPDDPGYNNDLGFIWADHDLHLPESEKMIRKALEEDKKQKLKANPSLKPDEVKDNPSYLDSLGWVLYKEKKYKDALKCLQDAVEDEGGKSVEIYDHLGDVYKALGQKEEAVAAWKKGLEMKGDGKRELARKAEIEKKVKDNE
jgi:tetratricopeptide (TPR) repeat protein